MSNTIKESELAALVAGKTIATPIATPIAPVSASTIRYSPSVITWGTSGNDWRVMKTGICLNMAYISITFVEN